MDGLLHAEKTDLTKAREALEAAGARSYEESTVNTAFNPSVRPPMIRPPKSEFRPGRNYTVDSSKHPLSGVDNGVLEMIAAALGKRGPGHQALMDIAHDCIGKLTDGACCTTIKVGARHSKETLDHLGNAHDNLVAAGASCGAAFAPEPEWEGTEFEPGKVTSGNLAKMLAGERAEKAALMATLSDIVPRLDQLTKRVEDIARTPLPPLAIAKNVTAISKQQDVGVDALSANEVAAAFSRMSKDEQTLALIKASYARPIKPPGLAPTKGPRPE
jgi:hypothetical protein